MTTSALKTPPTLEALRARRADILRLAEAHRATDVRVFGSVARGEATAGSDVDFLVRLYPNTSVFELVGLWLALQDLLGCEVSVISDQIDDEPFLAAALRDAAPL